MKSEKRRLNILTLLFIISLLITIICINSAYARYYEEMDTNYDLGGIKRWSIQVNNTDIYEKTDLREILQPVLIEDVNMRSNILVPGREGYFEIELDYSKVDMPFTANFSIEQTISPMLVDFEMYGYWVRPSSETGDEPELTEITIKKNSSTISPISFSIDFDPTIEDQEKVQTIRAYFRWNDDETALMDNVKDTDFRGKEGEANSNTLLEYTAKLTLTQKQD